jgi:hypothetical protein
VHIQKAVKIARYLEIEDIKRALHGHLYLERVTWRIFRIQILLIYSAFQHFRDFFSRASSRKLKLVSHVLYRDPERILIEHDVKVFDILSR